jgi:hypothetical protein
VKALINFSEEQVRALDQIARSQKIPRTRVVQEAVDLYLEQKSPAGGGLPPGFGAWKEKRVDGLHYQRKIRGEWEA